MQLRWRVSVLSALLRILWTSTVGHTASTSLVISQVYSSQDAKSRLRNDFIELFNLGTTTVNVTGYTVQVYGVSGGTWQSVNLTGSIAPGQYYLVAGASSNFDVGLYGLPTPQSTTSLAIQTFGGRLAIVNNAAQLMDSCPTDDTIVDIMSYGSASGCTGGTGPSLDSVTGIFRAGGGCTDTDSNSDDFYSARPIPRNTSSNRNVCGGTIGNATYSVSVPASGGVARSSSGANASITVGSARYTPAAGTNAPAGFAVFGQRQGTAVISEATVPATTAVTSALVFVELNGPIRTGVAVANPNDSNVEINFTFYDAIRGFATTFGKFTLPPQGQSAAFVDELPWGLLVNSVGDLELRSTAPVGITALRGYVNERSEFLTTTLPIIDLSVTPSTATSYLAHFAVEGGWRSQIVLMNSSGGLESGTIDFLNDSGNPIDVPFAGFTANSVPYSIDGKNALRFTINGTGSVTKTGYIRITPTTGSTPEALAVFGYRQNNVVVSESGITSIKGSRFRSYIETSGAIGAVGSVQSGLAILNTSTSQTISIDLELTRLDGSSSGIPKKTITLDPNSKIATYLTQQFPTMPTTFQGLLRVTTTGVITMMGLRLRVNTRGDLLSATVPPVDEAAAVSSNSLVFPQVADSGGYTTQFILYGATGLASTGTLQTYTIGGQPLPLQIQ